MSSIYGKNLKISLFGQSHSPGIGVTVEGLPPGFAVDFEELNDFMSRRRPGGSPFATPRREADHPEFLSGWECDLRRSSDRCYSKYKYSFRRL